MQNIVSTKNHIFIIRNFTESCNKYQQILKTTLLSINSQVNTMQLYFPQKKSFSELNPFTSSQSKCNQIPFFSSKQKNVNIQQQLHKLTKVNKTKFDSDLQKHTYKKSAAHKKQSPKKLSVSISSQSFQTKNVEEDNIKNQLKQMRQLIMMLDSIVNTYQQQAKQFQARINRYRQYNSQWKKFYKCLQFFFTNNKQQKLTSDTIASSISSQLNENLIYNQFEKTTNFSQDGSSCSLVSFKKQLLNLTLSNINQQQIVANQQSRSRVQFCKTKRNLQDIEQICQQDKDSSKFQKIDNLNALRKKALSYCERYNNSNLEQLVKTIKNDRDLIRKTQNTKEQPTNRKYFPSAIHRAGGEKNLPNQKYLPPKAYIKYNEETKFVDNIKNNPLCDFK